MAFFGQKWKKQGWILIGNKKFALWKCLYFCSKMHVGQVISHFIFFSWYPFGGILEWEYWPKLKSEKWNVFIFVNYNRNFMSIIHFWHFQFFNPPYCSTTSAVRSRYWMYKTLTVMPADNLMSLWPLNLSIANVLSYLIIYLYLPLIWILLTVWKSWWGHKKRKKHKLYITL